MGGSEKRTTLWIAITGGVYWSASVLFLTLWRPMFGAEAQGDATMRVVLWLFISVTIIALLAIYKQFMRPRVQQGLAPPRQLTSRSPLLPRWVAGVRLWRSCFMVCTMRCLLCSGVWHMYRSAKRKLSEWWPLAFLWHFSCTSWGRLSPLALGAPLLPLS